MIKNIFDDLTPPPAAALLGWKLLSIDSTAGEIEVQFDGKPEFTNPTGHIQGGFLSAMLDDTLGPAVFAMTNGKRLGRTIDLHVHFLRPAPQGKIIGRGKVSKLGQQVAYLEGQLFDKDGKLIARATASALMLDHDMPSFR